MPGAGRGQFGCGPGACAVTYTEQPVLMHCAGEPLVGMVTQPAEPCTLGLVVVVGGPQYRVGSHRQFVLLARRLAQAGFAVMRFDYRGMGDSGGEARGFESVDEDIATAVAALQQACPAVTRVVLWGLCDGASAALLYAGRQADERIAGLCLLNPWVRSDATLARTRLKHYYRGRLRQHDFWARLWQGRFDWRQSWHSLVHSVRAWASAKGRMGKAGQGASFQSQMATSLGRFKGQVLLILSLNDTTAQEFSDCVAADPAWQGLMQRPGLTRLELADADHTFSSAQWRGVTEQAVLQWMVALQAAP